MRCYSRQNFVIVVQRVFITPRRFDVELTADYVHMQETTPADS
jgi:hypothetical protein